MFLISMFVFLVLVSKFDMVKCMKMCLIYDMVELIVGDIIFVDGVLKQEKSCWEVIIMDYIIKGLLGNVDGGKVGEEICVIW